MARGSGFFSITGRCVVSISVEQEVEAFVGEQENHGLETVLLFDRIGLVGDIALHRRTLVHEEKGLWIEGVGLDLLVLEAETGLERLQSPWPCPPWKMSSVCVFQAAKEVISGPPPAVAAGSSGKWWRTRLCRHILGGGVEGLERNSRS